MKPITLVAALGFIATAACSSKDAVGLPLSDAAVANNRLFREDANLKSDQVNIFRGVIDQLVGSHRSIAKSVPEVSHSFEVSAEIWTQLSHNASNDWASLYQFEWDEARFAHHRAASSLLRLGPDTSMRQRLVFSNRCLHALEQFIRSYGSEAVVHDIDHLGSLSEEIRDDAFISSHNDVKGHQDH